MKITIIGAGNIGGATALGILKAAHIPADSITVTAAHKETLEKYATLGIHTTTDNIVAIKAADIIVIAVKPWIVPDIIEEIGPKIDYNNQIVVSMAPGIGPATIREMFADYGFPSIAYLIPNIAIEICESVNFIAPVNCTQTQTQMVVDMVAGTGLTKIVDPEKLIAGTALASCGIAYALRYIRASMEGGVELGLKADDAEAVVAQTVRGAAALLTEHRTHPEVEIDKVTTPGGLTIKGLNAMEANGFTNAVIAGLKAGK